MIVNTFRFLGGFKMYSLTIFGSLNPKPKGIILRSLSTRIYYGRSPVDTILFEDSFVASCLDS